MSASCGAALVVCVLASGCGKSTGDEGDTDSVTDTDTVAASEDTDVAPDTDVGPDPEVDADLDGFTVDDDCDDSDNSIHPRAPDSLCDGVDRDCDGADAASGVIWRGDDGAIVDHTSLVVGALATAPATLTLDTPGVLRICSPEIHTTFEVKAAGVRIVGQPDGSVRPVASVVLVHQLMTVAADASVEVTDVNLACDTCDAVAFNVGVASFTRVQFRGPRTVIGVWYDAGSELTMSEFGMKDLTRWVVPVNVFVSATGTLSDSDPLIAGDGTTPLHLVGDWTLSGMNTAGGGPQIRAKGNLHVSDSDMVGSFADALIQATGSGGSLTIEDSRLTVALGVNTDGPTEIRGTTFIARTWILAPYVAYAVLSSGADLTVSDSTFTGFVDGALLAEHPLTVTMTDLDFKPGLNKHSYDNGAIRSPQILISDDAPAPGAPEAVCTRCSISGARYNATGNTASLVIVAGRHLRWVDSTCSDNQVRFGGSCFGLEDAQLDIEGSTFDANVAGRNGGVIDALQSAITIHDSTFTNNQATSGGAISASGGTLSLVRTSFTGNAASGDGGAVHTGAILDLDDATFAQNSATGDGGALWFANTVPDAVTTRGVTTFEDNSAAGQGAALVVDAADSLLWSNLIFRRNASQARCGSAILVDGASMATNEQVRFESTQFSQGADDNTPGDLRVPSECVPYRYAATSSVTCSKSSCVEDP